MSIHFNNRFQPIEWICFFSIFLLASTLRAGAFDDFSRALLQDDARSISKLIQRGFDPNTPSEKGEHALFIALREPSPKAFEVLLTAPNIKVDTRNAIDETPLMMAALRGNLAAAKLLVARDADVNKTGWTPLHYAATNGHLEVIKFLLDEHAYIDTESPNGSTPLMMAARYATMETVKLLIDAGADVAAKNQAGLVATDFAAEGKRADIEALLKAALMTQKKLPKGSW